MKRREWEGGVAGGEGGTPEAGAMPAQSQAAALQGQPQRQQWLLLRQFGPSALRILFAKYPVVAAYLGERD